MKVDSDSFQINNKSNEDDNRFYTKIGSEDFIDSDSNPRTKIENHLTYAKAIKGKYTKSLTDKHTCLYKYYIKSDPNHKLFNPITTHSINSDRPNFINKICKTENVYTEVNESVFNKYLSFLRTLNSQWLTSAQREIK